MWLILARGLKVFFVFFARTAMHVQVRESEGTACVVVVSGSRFESFFFFARTGTHVWARTYGHVLVILKYVQQSRDRLHIQSTVRPPVNAYWHIKCVNVFNR